MVLQLKISEIDLFIYFYLQECGFIHTAFTFSQESNLNFLNINSKIIPPGLLVSLIQRGIAYSQIEMNSSPIFRNKSRSPFETFFLNKINYYKNMSFKKQKILKKSKENFLCNNYSIFCFSWHTRKCILFFGTRDSKIFKWQIKKEWGGKKKKKSFSTFSLNNNLSEKKDCVALDINIIGTLIATALITGEIFFLSESGKIIKKIFISELPIINLKWNENSKNILISNIKGEIFIFSLWYNQFLSKIFVFKDRLTSVHWSGWSNITCCGKENFVTGINIENKMYKNFKIEDLKSTKMSQCSATSTLGVCSENVVAIFHLNPNIIFEKFLGKHGNKITGIQVESTNLRKFKKTGTGLFLICLENHIINIWDLRKKFCVKEIIFENCIQSMTWCPMGRKIFIYDVSGEINVIRKNGITEKKLFWNFSHFLEIKMHPMTKKIAFIGRNSILSL